MPRKAKKGSPTNRRNISTGLKRSWAAKNEEIETLKMQHNLDVTVIESLRAQTVRLRDELAKPRPHGEMMMAERVKLATVLGQLIEATSKIVLVVVGGKEVL